MIARRIVFEGRVQGVGFRYTVKDLARGFDVSGWVKNLADGSVELVLIGEMEEVDSMIHEITVESPVAHHIRHLRTEQIDPPPSVLGFTIQR